MNNFHFSQLFILPVCIFAFISFIPISARSCCFVDVYPLFVNQGINLLLYHNKQNIPFTFPFYLSYFDNLNGETAVIRYLFGERSPAQGSDEDSHQKMNKCTHTYTSANNFKGLIDLWNSIYRLFNYNTHLLLFHLSPNHLKNPSG